MSDMSELWAALITAGAGALAVLVRKFVPLRRVSEIAGGVADTVDDVTTELQIIAAEQREAYDHLRERLQFLMAENANLMEKLRELRLQLALTAEALEVASERIAELTAEETD